MTRTEREDYWRQHVGAATRHPGSIRSYCRDNGLAEPSLYYWKRRLAPVAFPWIELPAPSSLQSLPPSAEDPTAPLLSVEHGGLRLSFQPGCPPEWAAACCAALAAATTGGDPA